VKLSQRGRDYLKACLFGAIIASLLDVRAVLALCLSLLFAAAISEALLASSTTGNIRVELEEPHLTCFKGGESVEKVNIRLKRRRFIRILVSSVKGPRGVETIANETDSDSSTFTFRPKYAGRFRGLSVTFEFQDPLGLFRKTLDVTREDFVLDCYPESLLKDVRQAAPMTLALGERAGRTHGSGQEFYSIDEYNSSVERKNIYWKKIASLPDERLLVKVREANIPNFVTIGLVKTDPRQQNDLQWMDLACEAAAILGTNVFAFGCDVILTFYSGAEMQKLESSDALEFRESLMEMSQASPSQGEYTSEILNDCDICITGFAELKDNFLASEVSRRPSVLIKDAGEYPNTIGNLALIYTGSEDVSELVNRVVRR
jgi:uncharacterized protein (DUF58 family)